MHYVYTCVWVGVCLGRMHHQAPELCEPNLLRCPSPSLENKEATRVDAHEHNNEQALKLRGRLVKSLYKLVDGLVGLALGAKGAGERNVVVLALDGLAGGGVHLGHAELDRAGIPAQTGGEPWPQHAGRQAFPHLLCPDQPVGVGALARNVAARSGRAGWGVRRKRAAAAREARGGGGEDQPDASSHDQGSRCAAAGGRAARSQTGRGRPAATSTYISTTSPASFCILGLGGEGGRV
jgi:hypothetical protein